MKHIKLNLYYVTSNTHKFSYALKRLANYDIKLKQIFLDLAEIQSDTVKRIVTHKATTAYQELQAPLVVSDVEWNIPALNGFPGTFMAYVDKWLSADDFLRLMKGIDDRRVTYTEAIMYIDNHQHQFFQTSVEGIILQEDVSTDTKGFGNIFSFRLDKKSLNQARLEKLPAFDQDLDMWDQFSQWFVSAS